MVIFFNIFSIWQGKGLTAEEYTKLKAFRTNLFRWVATVRKNIILDFDLIGAPAKKKPKLATPTLEEKLEESSKNKAAKATKESSVFAIDTSKPATSSTAANVANSSTADEYEDEDLFDANDDKPDKKRSKLHNEIIKHYPNVASTGIFMYADANNDIVVIMDDETNRECMQLVYNKECSSSSNK